MDMHGKAPKGTARRPENRQQSTLNGDNVGGKIRRSPGDAFGVGKVVF